MDKKNMYISNDKINPLVCPNNFNLRFLINRHVYFVEGNHIIFETQLDNLPENLCLIDSNVVIPKDIAVCEEYVEYTDKNTVHGYFVAYAESVIKYNAEYEIMDFYDDKALDYIDLIIQSINHKLK